MSETIVQTAILVFAAGIVGFALGCLVARLFATSASGEQAPAGAQASAQPPPARASTAAQPAASASAPAEPVAAAAAAPQSEQAQAATSSSQPVSASAAPAAGQEGTDKPLVLAAPRDGSADNLQQIKGVGPELEQMLNGFGIYHLDQIANWTRDNVAWMLGNPNVQRSGRGRTDLEDWVAQANELSGK